MLSVQIIPRPDLSPDELRYLGQSLAAWYERESGAGGAVLHIDHEGLQSLLCGEPPAPAAMRHVAMIERMREEQGLPPFSGAERKEVLARWLALNEVPEAMRSGFARLASSRVVLVEIATEEGRASLRQALPEGLVESVVGLF